MKYIRTKEELFVKIRDCTHNMKENIVVGKTPVDFGKYLPIKDIIKESDSIDELCDEYVIPKFRDVFVIDAFSKQICVNHIKCGNGDVYGAIWTDKGLIYVAKMNSKGELELI